VALRSHKSKRPPSSSFSTSGHCCPSEIRLRVESRIQMAKSSLRRLGCGGATCSITMSVVSLASNEPLVGPIFRASS